MKLYIFIAALLPLLQSCGSTLTVSASGVKRAINGTEVRYLYPNEVKGGESIIVRGTKFGEGLRLSVNGEDHKLEIVDENQAKFLLSESVKSGVSVLKFSLDGEDLTEMKIVKQGEKLQLANLDPAKVCKGEIYLNADLAVTEGSLDCDAAAVSSESVADCKADGEINCKTGSDFPAVNKRDILSAQKALWSESLIIAGVKGEMKACSTNQSDDCFLAAYASGTQDLKAFDISALLPAKIKNGETIAGVAGNVQPKPADCSSDGGLACVTTSSYPALDKAAFQAAAAQIEGTLSLAGLSGSMQNCTTLGSNCYLPTYQTSVQKLKAIDFDTITTDVIKDGSTVAGVLGILVSNPANCGSNGQTACLATVAYPAMKKSNATANKVHSSLTLGTLVGTMNDCGTDGQDSCFTVTNFPATQKSAVDGAKASIRTSLTLAGVAGTLADCSNNASNCFLPTYAPGTQDRKAVNYDNLSPSIIKVGTTISDVGGALVEKPADCAANNGVGCVAVAAYPAALKSTLTSNQSLIHTTVSIAGVSGLMNSCATTGDISCLSTSTYPSVSLANISGNRPKFRSSATLMGSTGQMDDCGADNGVGCYAVTNYPATETSAVDTLKASYPSTLTFAGVAGTMATCAANGSNCSLATYANPTQPLKAVDYSTLIATNLEDDFILSDVTGTMVPKPVDCALDAAVGCVAVTDYPSVDHAALDAAKASFHSTQTMGGVAGTLPSCNSDGGNNCLSTTNFPAVDVTAVDGNKAKFRSTLTLGGVAGTMAACAANASNCYLPTYVNTTQPLKAIDFDSLDPTKIRVNTSIGTVAGSAVPLPATCNSDGSTDCVTDASFPAMDKNAVDGAKAGMHTTLTLGGVQGTAGTCNSDNGSGCLTSASYPSVNRTTVDSNKALFLSTLTIAGIAGTMSDCAGNGSNCYLATYSVGAQPLKAINYDGLSAGLIKKNESIGGVTGDYPSSTYPMATGDAHTDLTTGNFVSRVSDAATFGWFNRNGTRVTAAGDTDLAVGNIANTADIFTFSGTIPALTAWNVRYGKTHGNGNTGKLKMNCRNPSLVSAWDVGRDVMVTWTAANDTITAASHPFSNGQTVQVAYDQGNTSNFSDYATYYVINATTNTFQLSTTSGGSVYDIQADSWASSTSVRRINDGSTGYWDNYDNDNNNGTIPTQNPWGNAEASCGGKEATAGDDNVWKDVTTGGCSAPGNDCRFLDKITNIEWSEYIATLPQVSAIAYCDQMTFDGKTDWRLPTIAEWQTAMSHQFYSVHDNNWLSRTTMNNIGYWSSTRVSNIMDSQAWFANLRMGYVQNTSLSASGGVVCIRSDDP